jgi:DNA-binding MarR family transcriptional regulator
MGEIVADLEARGYVRREPDPTDGRAKTIGFTDRGWHAVETALDAFDQIERELADRIGGRRLTQLRRILEDVAGGAHVA